MNTSLPPVQSCPVCLGECTLLDVVDLNKSCEEARGHFLPLAGVPIYYVMCEKCRFSFAPEMHDWSIEDFSARIYNKEYIDVDPDYLVTRPTANAAALRQLMGATGAMLRHLDYGGGHGLLSDRLRDSGWNSTSYDPFVDRAVTIEELGQFDLITAYEVFEHVPDVRGLLVNLAKLASREGVVLFTTLVSDQDLARNKRITWWYASPRNGHISLYTRDSLYYLASTQGMSFASFSDNFHAYWRTRPEWARNLLPE